ncbi:hypothetical protein [Dyadobacter fermentans]|uniref:Uncharacterized protein n=1 Tax=Dyadobacter fermentans (strain ATCC 700827 / DSM 18053 / CIP 107007 / KCTC 52180 / NS114) TaxID=471854 RepID=C6VY17_DYAFD|nr:hypothetical protein [Dyadobacter fermentans]ACT96918.1 hypothetical protein Dfer_5730 [Dyadobacter fermentans DSM 18053]
MAQLLQQIYHIAPVLLTIALFGAAICGIWLVADLKKRSAYNRYSMSDRLFLKRNANRLRKMQLH